MSELIPKLNRIRVSPDKLILDPNNPRLISRLEDRVKDENMLDMTVLENTRKRMEGGSDDVFQIKELERSIRTNGWQPIDSIFVHKCDDTRYIVLEGNRRATAIRNLLSSEIPQSLKEELSDIEVMEVLGENLSSTQLEAKVSYLLGVRHHGSLRQWSPFAQSNNIYLEYLKLTALDDDSFVWNEESGRKMAETLGIKLELVKERLRVFRAMKQIGSTDKVAMSEGGMKDRYYSVCQAALQDRSKLGEYIKQDADTFLLDESSVERMDNLCHFSTKGRDGAPINNPAQWKAFANILSDDDEEKRTKMLAEVEANKKRPDTIWAQRAEELRRPQWDRWLEKVEHVLRGLNIGNIDLDSIEARQMIEKLVRLLARLDDVTTVSGGANA